MRFVAFCWAVNLMRIPGFLVHYMSKIMNHAQLSTSEEAMTNNYGASVGKPNILGAGVFLSTWSAKKNQRILTGIHS
jgi:hypothetical protein